ncbi:DUF1232 domain-containing protein [Candidatus Woesearchaeota archaeon]|nr:MAG: DUF1232 domain-containing protein [Candidatus Woesearchaeota archaeon]
MKINFKMSGENTMSQTKTGSNETSQFLGFQEALKNTISSYDGSYKDVVQYCPALFDLLCKILNDKTADWNTKLMIDAALAYFVLPEDIIPDYEDVGYVDDLFIVCHVLKEIKEKNSSDLIKSNWDGKEDIIELVEDLYNKSSRIVANHTLDILRKVGLHKYQSLDLAEYSGSYPEKLVKLGNEKRELLGLLAYLVKQIYCANVKNYRTEQLKEFLQQNGDIDEINRLIELSKRNHNYEFQEKKTACYVNNNTSKKSSIEELEAKLKAARLNAFMQHEKED